MAWRIGEYIVAGELNNSRRNSVTGWFDFGDEWGVRVELTGNLEGDLEGRHIRFTCAPSDDPRPPTPRDDLESLADIQIGTTGNMLLRIVRVPRGPIGEYYLRCKLGEPTPIDEKPCLYLEWFSQNGRVVAEIVDPQIENVTKDERASPDIEPEPLPPADEGAGGPQIIGFAMNEDGSVEELSFDDAQEPDDDDDPYGLFPAGLDQQLGASLGGSGDDSVDESGEPRPRAWDEVIPGIDPETKALYEQWDDILGGEHDEPVAAMFDPPLKLPPPDKVTDEAMAEGLLKILLARLAIHSIVLDMCEHVTAQEAYRYLMEEILPEAQIHPDAGAAGFIQHYSTWDNCPQCQAEMDEEFRQEHGDPPSDEEE